MTCSSCSNITCTCSVQSITVQATTPVRSRIKDIQKDQKRRRSILEDRRQRLSETVSVSLTQSPGTETPKTLSEAELRHSFDEWMKVVADNVIMFFSFQENQCNQLLDIWTD